MLTQKRAGYKIYSIQRRSCHCRAHSSSARNHESSVVSRPFLAQHPHGRPQQHEANPVCWWASPLFATKCQCILPWSAFWHNQRFPLLNSSIAANSSLFAYLVEFRCNNKPPCISHAHYLSKSALVGTISFRRLKSQMWWHPPHVTSFTAQAHHNEHRTPHTKSALSDLYVMQ